MSLARSTPFGGGPARERERRSTAGALAYDMKGIFPLGPAITRFSRRLENNYCLPSLASIASQIATARSGPPSRLTARIPVGEVTLISVR